MKKLIIVALALIGIGTLASLLAAKFKTMDWEQRLEKMPDNAPPKWMFRSISEIRENTERILEKLDAQTSAT
jgi:hypothetical protein